MSEKIKLTQTVLKGGCAAKVAATELRKILSEVRFPPAPKELTIDAGTFDDAAIFQISSELSLVQTLDFFTPIVDSPFLFGKIAAANALSDVYAMGGRPQTAMAIFAFPLATMDSSVAVEVLQGASDILAEAKAAFVGGHTIDDDTMKFGLSVTGTVHPQKIWSNSKAAIGDDLILTKAIGTGTLTAALKRGEVTEDEIQDGILSMTKLNNIIDYLDENEKMAIHAATDITGFGLSGHAMNLARASHVTLYFESASIPRFSRAMEFIEKGFLTKAHRTNAEYVQNQVQFSQENKDMSQLFYDPQTSGGLLLAVDPKSTQKILDQIKDHFPQAAKVGQVRQSQTCAIMVD